MVGVDDEGVTIDANHPLAGKDLTFDVELTKRIPAAELETAAFGAGCFWCACRCAPCWQREACALRPIGAVVWLREHSMLLEGRPGPYEEHVFCGWHLPCVPVPLCQPS